MTAHVIRQDERGQRWCTAHCEGPHCWLNPDVDCYHRCFRSGQRLEDDLDRLGPDTVAELPLLTLTEEAPWPAPDPCSTPPESSPPSSPSASC